jgi:uncharacterized protein DUF4314
MSNAAPGAKAPRPAVPGPIDGAGPAPGWAPAPPITPTVVGRRVRLIRCLDQHTKLEPGQEGRVALVDAMGTVHVVWDDGHMLGLIPECDQWEWADAPTTDGSE